MLSFRMRRFDSSWVCRRVYRLPLENWDARGHGWWYVTALMCAQCASSKSNRATEHRTNKFDVSFLFLRSFASQFTNIFYFSSCSCLCLVPSMTMLICIRCGFRERHEKTKRKTEVSSISDLMRLENAERTQPVYCWLWVANEKKNKEYPPNILLLK